MRTSIPPRFTLSLFVASAASCWGQAVSDPIRLTPPGGKEPVVGANPLNVLEAVAMWQAEFEGEVRIWYTVTSDGFMT